MIEEPQKKPTLPNPNPIKDSKVFSWELYMHMMVEFGVIIALPLLIFLFLGPILDFIGLDTWAEWAKYNRAESRLYNALGILGAIFISFYAIIKKILGIQKLLKQ
jgi:hypothetical protein